MDSVRALAPDFFADLETTGRLEAAILLKRNGRLVAAWARNPVSWEVVTVMAATTLGSLETLLETLGLSSPKTITFATASHRIYFQKVEPQAALVLVAVKSMGEDSLRDLAARILSRLPSSPNGTPSRHVTLGPNVRSDSRGSR